MKLTNDHVYLLDVFICMLNLEYSLSNISVTKGFVRELKKATNKYKDFIETDVYRRFKATYELDEELIELLFNKAKKRVEFQREEFIKDMISI